MPPSTVAATTGKSTAYHRRAKPLLRYRTFGRRLNLTVADAEAFRNFLTVGQTVKGS
ncbi:hypothetical protein [Neisseria gonorrhoeae]|uniref:hypothetical protein n=1 Tax=Neisseria gonorrhoeae TaxID=485 RepID=UPI0018E05773|nr:hypothetical protein [Neisseria gonorrhoeae]